MTATLSPGSFVIKATTVFNRMFPFGTTGQTVSVAISRGGGGAFSAAAGTVTEIANGWYNIAYTTADTGLTGMLVAHATAASGGPCDFCDLVSAQVTTDIVLNASGRVLAGNVLQQNQPVSAFPFTMTKAGVPIPGIGSSIVAQRNFGSGWSNMSNSGTYTDVGFGNYFIALTNLDTNGTSVIYRFTSPSADDNNIIIFFSP